jgi:hypothetical protein
MALSSAWEKEKQRQRVFESKVMRIFGTKKEVTGRWRKWNVEESSNLHSSSNIASQRMGWAGHVVHMENLGIY